MTDQKRVVVLPLDSYGGLFVRDAPDDVAIVLLSYSDGEQAIDGANLDDEDMIEDLEDQRIEVRRNVLVGHMGDGTPMHGNEAFRRYIVTGNGMSHPGHYGTHLTPEEQAAEDALFEQYAATVEV